MKNVRRRSQEDAAVSPSMLDALAQVQTTVSQSSKTSTTAQEDTTRDTDTAAFGSSNPNLGDSNATGAEVFLVTSSAVHQTNATTTTTNSAAAAASPVLFDTNSNNATDTGEDTYNKTVPLTRAPVVVTPPAPQAAPVAPPIRPPTALSPSYTPPTTGTKPSWVPPKKPTFDTHGGNTPPTAAPFCSGASCRIHNPTTEIGIVVLLACLILYCCCCGRCRRWFGIGGGGYHDGLLDTSRGQYRAVANQYTARTFDDAFDDDLSDYEDDEDLDTLDSGCGDTGDDYYNSSRNGHHVIEMKDLEKDRGRLSLKEMNG